MKKEKKKHLIKGSIQYDKKPIKRAWLEERVLSKEFKNLLEEKGVYILYKKRKKEYNIVYVGIAGFGRGKNLFGRLKSHTKHRLKRKWDYFTAFIIPVSEKNKRYLKDIEGVLIRAIEPPENKTTPTIIKEWEYQRKIKRIVREQVKEVKDIIRKGKSKNKKIERELKESNKKIEKKHKERMKKLKNLLT